MAHAILGIVLNRDGRPDEAAAELATAIRLNPNPTPTLEYSRGQLKAFEGAANEGIEYARTALRLR